MRTLRITCIAAVAACGLAGCAVRYTEPLAASRQLTPAERDFEAVWQASRETLRGYRFELDREDRRAGIITTPPMTGMHFFEFWRNDAVRPTEYAESTVQTIYRTARVTVRPTQPGAETYQAAVQVLLRRSDRPHPQVTSTSEAYSLITTGSDPKKRRRMLLAEDWRQAEEETFVELGNDRALEAKLTAEIAEAADRLRGVAPARSQPPATQPAK